MIHFFFVLLGITTLAVTTCVVWPLRASSPRLFIVLLACTPILLFMLYQITGTPAALVPGAVNGAKNEMPQSLDEAIAQLEKTLQHSPNQPEGWVLLARAFAAQGNLTHARDAWARALELVPDEPILLTEAAQARAQVDPQNRFDDEAMALLERAVALQPEHQRARWFIGVAQRQRGEDAKAVKTWEALLPLVDANTAASLREQINDARRGAGLPLLVSEPAAAPVNTHSITINVSLAEALRTRADLDPNATIFVFARLPDGPSSIPVAALRLRLGDLPASVTLNDTSSPMPTQTLSDLSEVEILARLSVSGSAVRQDGDIESAPVRIRLPHQGHITLVIGRDDK